MSTGSPQGGDDWKPGERRYRKWEVALHAVSLLVTLVIVAATIWAAASASKAAEAAAEAVSVAQAAIERGASEARYSAGVQAIGGDLAVERVAGFTMLRRNVEDRLRDAQAVDAESYERARGDALALFQVTLDVYENYLKFPPDGEPADEAAPPPAAAAGGVELTTGDQPFAERMFGEPDRPQDQIYAAANLRGILGDTNRAAVDVLSPDEPINVDLAAAPLYGQTWRGIDFSWLDAKYFVAIDLRGADLTRSEWGNATLTSAHFQCADLAGARLNTPDPESDDELIGANLRRARLTNANLQGADLRDVDLTGADLTGAYVEGAMLDGAVLDEVTTTGVVGHPASGTDIGEIEASDVAEYEVGRCLDEGHALE
ncbi:pentapeptide repeat-containing protein [Geodermatophilus sp. CPCC 206100]|uniref:pentapeptide repeat-containing protein n=1 Tax=Geodermatophilus sp. CPCC 206100 TaxID=3020054 RepID=UPI003B00DE51